MGLNNMGLGFTVQATDQASQVFDKVGGKLGGLKKKGEDSSTSMKEVNAEIGSMGAKMMGAGLATFAALGYASVKAAEFEKAIALVASEADLAIFPQSEMARVTQELAGKFGRLPVQEANALYKAVALGANDATKATQLMTGANLLAVAGNADLELTMNALGGALNAYGGDMSKATDFSDVLFTTMKNGNTTVGELAASIGHITSAAANLKVPFDQIMGAVAVMTNKGVAAAEAVTGLKAAFQSIQHPTSEAAAEAARLGIKFNAAELRAKGLPAFLNQITTNSKFTADSMAKLFAGEGANAIAQVTSDSAALSNVMAEMGKRSGATAAGFEILSNTTAFQADRLNSLKDSALILIGDAIKPLSVAVLKFAVMAVEWFTKLPKPLIKIVTIGAALFATFLTGVGGAMVLGAAIGGLVIAAKAIGIGLLIVVGALAQLAIMMLPAIAIAVLLYTVWTKNVGGIATSVGIWFDKIGMAFKALYQLFTQGGFSMALNDELNNGNEGIRGFAINVYLWFNRIKNFFVNIGQAFTDGMGAISPVIEKIISAVQRLAGRFMGTQEVASQAKDKFTEWGEIGKKVGGFLVMVFEKVVTILLGVVNFVDGCVESFMGFKPVLDAVWDAAGEVFKILADLFSMFSSSNAGAQSTADTWRTVGNVLGWIANVGLTVVVAQFRVLGGALSMIGGVVSGVAAFFQGFIETVSIGIRFLIAIFSGEWGQAWDLAKKGVETWAQTIIQMFLKVVAGAAGMIDSLGKIFHVDLGLKGKVEGASAAIGGPGATKASSPPGLPAPAAGAPASPAVAAAGGQAANTAALGAAVASAPAAKPADVNIKTTLTVDGQVLADVVQKHGAQNANRSFAPAGPTANT